MSELNYLILWGVLPPLLLLFYYFHRVSNRPSLFSLLLFFALGAISGGIALILQSNFEIILGTFTNWQSIRGYLAVEIWRQLVKVAPIEETCKLATVFIPAWFFQRRYKLRRISLFLFAIAVCLGFTAQQNCVYLINGTESIVERLIRTPTHAIFSAPWAYAIAITVGCRIDSEDDRKLFPQAWINSIICHALVNILASASREPSLSFLSYGLFPLLLWMFWRLEKLLRKIERKSSIILVTAKTRKHRYFQRGLILLTLILGGNAIFGLFLLARILSPLSWGELLEPSIFWFTLSRCLVNIGFGIVAWGIYRYLYFSGSQYLPQKLDRLEHTEESPYSRSQETGDRSQE